MLVLQRGGRGSEKFGDPIEGPHTDLAPKTETGGLAMPAGVLLRQLARGEGPQLMSSASAQWGSAGRMRTPLRPREGKEVGGG